MSREAPPAATEQPSPAAGASAKADASGQAAPKGGNTSRKIVRQAELELEVAAPGFTQTAIERRFYSCSACPARSASGA